MAPRKATIEKEIFALLDKRGLGKTICPSEVARALSKENWRPLMEPVRTVARALWDRDRVKITQRGRAVDPHRAKGAIRIARR